MDQNILLVLEGVLQQLRISRDQGPFLWGTPSHQTGFGAETMLAPYLGLHAAECLCRQVTGDTQRTPRSVSTGTAHLKSKQ